MLMLMLMLMLMPQLVIARLSATLVVLNLTKIDYLLPIGVQKCVRRNRMFIKMLHAHGSISTSGSIFFNAWKGKRATRPFISSSIWARITIATHNQTTKHLLLHLFIAHLQSSILSNCNNAYDTIQSYIHLLHHINILIPHPILQYHLSHHDSKTSNIINTYNIIIDNVVKRISRNLFLLSININNHDGNSNK